MSKRINIDEIAMLAKLNISEGEREILQKDMRDIIGMISVLSELEAGEELINITDLKNIMREDKPGNGWDRAELLSNAPTKTDEYIFVPNVMERELS